MPTASPLRLGVNVDHVATLRNARGGARPDPVRAALLAIEAGADGITAHLREDRRHIRDEDMARLKAEISKPLNFEMAATDDMLRISLAIRPHAVCLVPERRQELTTEGGLDVVAHAARVRDAAARLGAAGIRVSLFVDPDAAQLTAGRMPGVHAVELHTGDYANASDDTVRRRELERLVSAAGHARELGLEVHAGHGLTVGNVGPVAAIPEIVELNIGHSLVARAVTVGIAEAVREMQVAMGRGRRP
jgi:pyridoxine 5-phosphate synthase